MKIINSLKKRFIYIIFMLPRFLKYYILSTCDNVKGKAKFIQPCQLNGKGEIIFSDKVIIGCSLSPFLYSGYGYIEARNKNSKIIIGDNVIINNNIVLISEGEGITISKNTLIGTNCEIYDSDFHNISIDKRISGKPSTKKVFIGENVFIGSNVKILKGVSIGNNAVISNGSIVTKNIQNNVVAGGIPAEFIKHIN